MASLGVGGVRGVTVDAATGGAVFGGGDVLGGGGGSNGNFFPYTAPGAMGGGPGKPQPSHMPSAPRLHPQTHSTNPTPHSGPRGMGRPKLAPLAPMGQPATPISSKKKKGKSKKKGKKAAAAAAGAQGGVDEP